jgi:hypothetical protein
VFVRNHSITVYNNDTMNTNGIAATRCPPPAFAASTSRHPLSLQGHLSAGADAVRQRWRCSRCGGLRALERALVGSEADGAGGARYGLLRIYRICCAGAR